MPENISKIMQEHQMLLWCQFMSAEGRTDRISMGIDLRNLGSMLFGENATDKRTRAMFRDLVSEGAIVENEKTWSLGPGFADALSTRRPARRAVTAGDISGWAGNPRKRRISLKAELGEDPVLRAGLCEMINLQREGRLEKIDGLDEGRIASADDWNRFVDTGVLTRDLVFILRDCLSGYVSAELIGDLLPGQLPATADLLNKGIAAGFSIDDPTMMLGGVNRSHDRKTGEDLYPVLPGWQLTFYTCREEDNYDFQPLDLEIEYPDVVHIEIDTGGDLCLFSGRSTPEAITKALYQSQEEIELPYHFNADKGSFEHAVQTYEKTGVMSVYLGDFFPKPVTDTQSGALLLLAYGEVVSPEEARELEAEDDADYRDGYFIRDDTRYRFSDMSGIEQLNIASFDHLSKIISKGNDVGLEVAKGIIEEEAQSSFAHLYRAEGLPEKMHLYIPYGRGTEEFEAACTGAGIKGALSGGQMGMVLSPEPIDFKDALVQTVSITPAQPAAEESPSP
ncbi:hypothetical protein [Pseudosulfitobacter pseudonitzschiae]|uniref:hypothetical protein n=1 Tax=Pseudosulfitobacter pseudonitzschiae TaxID=1402135 RepID=UPI003B7B4ED3